jgi:hypothetical protein
MFSLVKEVKYTDGQFPDLLTATADIDWEIAEF